MKYVLKPGFVYRKTDNMIILAIITFTFFVMLSQIKSLILSYIIILGIFLMYRFIILRIIKNNTEISICENKFILKSLLVKKSVDISDIEIIGYVQHSNKAGDLILNLNGLKLVNIYWNNLITESIGFSNSRRETIVIPDIINVKELYLELIKLMEIKDSVLREVFYKNSKLKIMEKTFLISNKKSEMIFLSKKALRIEETNIKIKLNDLSLNTNTFKKAELPLLNYKI